MGDIFGISQKHDLEEYLPKKLPQDQKGLLSLALVDMDQWGSLAHAKSYIVDTVPKCAESKPLFPPSRLSVHVFVRPCVHTSHFSVSSH